MIGSRTSEAAVVARLVAREVPPGLAVLRVFAELPAKRPLTEEMTEVRRTGETETGQIRSQQRKETQMTQWIAIQATMMAQGVA